MALKANPIKHEAEKPVQPVQAKPVEKSIIISEKDFHGFKRVLEIAESGFPEAIVRDFVEKFKKQI